MGKKPPRRWLRRLMALVSVAVAFVVLLIATCSIIVWSEAHEHVYTVEDVPPTDVTLVFGAMMWGDAPSPWLQGRLDQAAALYHAGKTKLIIVSGSNTPGDDEPAGMTAALLAQGVPADMIVQDYGGLDTYTSCLRARDVYGAKSLIVVTNKFHLPRAVTTCRMLGIDAVGVGDIDQPSTLRWRVSQVRELLADVKLMLDRVTGRG